MRIPLPRWLLIPYGVDTWRFDAVRLAGDGPGLALETPFPCAFVDRATGKPLRINNARLDLSTARPPEDKPASPLVLVHDHLKRLCAPWDPQAHLFVDAYLAFLAERIEASREELEAGLAPYAGLFTVSDWIYSAPVPLPRAHVHAPGERQPSGNVAPGEQAYVPVDFALWRGDRLVAVLAAQTRLTPARARERAARLAAAGIETITFGRADLTAPDGAIFTRLLGPRLRFWDGERLPSGPVRPPALDF